MTVGMGFRQRLVSQADALDPVRPSITYVFQYGTVRVQEPSPIELIVGKGRKKFIFSDHLGRFEHTWVYLSHDLGDAAAALTAQKIAHEEGFGEYLGNFHFTDAGMSQFTPREGLIPSIARAKIRAGVEAVQSGVWSNSKA